MRYNGKKTLKGCIRIFVQNLAFIKAFLDEIWLIYSEFHALKSSVLFMAKYIGKHPKTLFLVRSIDPIGPKKGFEERKVKKFSIRIVEGR